MSKSKEDALFYENTTGYLKNHWTKHIHFDALFVLITMGTEAVIYNHFDFFFRNDHVES